MSDQFLGQNLTGKYRIEEFWRADAASKTYHAVQTSIDKPVTIKILNPDLAEYSDIAEGLQTEARTISRIANPHILNVLDVDKDERGTPFLVLEAGVGRSLREFIKNEGGSPLGRAVSIVRQIADGLTIAHSKDVFHSDLSTDNILLTERGETDFVKILDFGAVNENQFDDEKTIVRSQLPFYKAPEQLSSDEKPDARTDIYALGVMLFEILTGRPPFVDENAAALGQKHLREIPPSLIAARPDLPPNLEQVVQRALAKQPIQRFQSAAEFSEALDNAVRSGSNAVYAGNLEPTEARQIPPAGPQNGANNPYKTAFIVLIGIVALSVFGIYSTGGFRNTPTIQANSDPNALPVQPLNPASSNGEDLSNLGLQPLGNSSLDPAVVTPGSGGAPPGGIAPPMGGGIPPGLYPSGGQTVVVPGNSNSIFMSDLNSNAGYPVNGNNNRNANIAVNSNLKPPANTNTAPSPQRPANSNTGSSINTNSGTPPAPTPAPNQKPTPRPTPKPPSPTPAKPTGGTESLGKSAPSGTN